MYVCSHGINLGHRSISNQSIANEAMDEKDTHTLAHPHTLVHIELPALAFGYFVLSLAMNMRKCVPVAISHLAIFCRFDVTIFE